MSRPPLTLILLATNLFTTHSLSATTSPSTTPSEPFPATIELRTQDKPEPITGTLLSYTETTLTFKTSTETRTYQWIDLTGPSVYAIYSKLIDKNDAPAWLKLGTFVFGMGDRPDATKALNTAKKLDPSLYDDIDAVLASTAGIIINPPPPKPTNLIHEIPATQPSISTQKYRPIYPAQARLALSQLRAASQDVNKQMRLNLKEIETTHFLIYTDWEASESDFLRTNFEAAYVAVSKQFDIPPEENIFVGKLSAYVFNNRDDFLKFGQTFDYMPPDRTDLAGFYTSYSTLHPHMAMARPGKLTGAVDGHFVTGWQYVLTHEFTHAFVARYRTNRPIPTWLNEGIAEFIASSVYPRNIRKQTQQIAKTTPSLTPLFTAEWGLISADSYPVVRTVTEVLVKKDHKKFIQMFDEIKEGQPTEKALADCYNMTFADLESEWRDELKDPTPGQ